MKITLLHPSRGRAEKAYRTYNKWINFSSNLIELEHILSIDTDDIALNKYVALFTNSKVITSPNTCLVEATNNGVTRATGDIIVLLSDDFDCFRDWDILITDAFKNQTCKVLKTFDGVQQWIVTLPIMDKAYYEMQGYFYYPKYRHMFCDTDMTHKAELEGNLIVRNDLLFTHEHYSTVIVAKDTTNEKADSTWQQGENVYLERVKTNFEITYPIDVLNLCSEAKHHINWLKARL